MAKSTKYTETPLNSARRAEIWLPRGCPGGAKNTTHTLAGEAAPVYDHARDEYKQRSCLRCAGVGTSARMERFSEAG